LLARQTNAELGKSFHASAVRLETALAVQNQSQWKLNFDPRFQHVTLHWIRVARGGEQIDHLNRERMRLIQRETQLEHHVINGSWTLLVVLDDVRTGDIIEAGYTVEQQHPINAGWCEVFFGVPAQVVVGRFRVAVFFLASRTGMAWKASSDAPPRRETAADGRISWSWEGAQPTLRDPEDNTPGSHLDYIWIQVSDLPGWNSLGRRAAEQWETVGSGVKLEARPEFARPPLPDGAAVTRLVRHIQDNFRYLSIDLATGGWVPTDPETVSRQRFGDCKDLVWLATKVLRGWGVSARPVLVGSGFRRGVASLLPMAGLFNHALLEVDLAGWRRWFDLTARSQGGDYFSLSVGLFGWGLPVDESADDLQEQPNPSMPHQYVMRETIYIDTRKGRSSLVEQRLWMNGYHADNMRRTRLAQGTDGFAAEWLKHAEKRYGKVVRHSPSQWRDDREKNVCEVLETYSISNFLTNEGGKRVTYDLPTNLAIQFIALPPDKPRRTPWSLPYPLEMRHLVTVIAPKMGNRGWQRRKWTHHDFFGSLSDLRPSKAWSKSSRVVLNVQEVAADGVGAYRTHLFDFFKAIPWRIYLPGNRAHPKLDANFGKLLPEGAGPDAYVPAEDLSKFPEAVLGQPPKRHWRERLTASKMLRWFWLLWFLIIILGAVLSGSK